MLIVLAIFLPSSITKGMAVGLSLALFLLLHEKDQPCFTQRLNSLERTSGIIIFFILYLKMFDFEIGNFTVEIVILIVVTLLYLIFIAYSIKYVVLIKMYSNKYVRKFCHKSSTMTKFFESFYFFLHISYFNLKKKKDNHIKQEIHEYLKNMKSLAVEEENKIFSTRPPDTQGKEKNPADYLKLMNILSCLEEEMKQETKIMKQNQKVNIIAGDKDEVFDSGQRMFISKNWLNISKNIYIIVPQFCLKITKNEKFF